MEELKIEYDNPAPHREKSKGDMVSDAVIDFINGSHSSIEIDMDTTGKAGYYIGTVKRTLRRWAAENDRTAAPDPLTGTIAGFRARTIGTKIRVERVTDEDD